MTSIEGLDLELVIDAYRLMDIDSDHLNTHTRTTIVIMVVLWHHHCERTLEDRRTLLHAVLDVLRGEEVGLALALDRDLAIVLEQDRTDGLRGILSTHTQTRTHTDGRSIRYR